MRFTRTGPFYSFYDEVPYLHLLMQPKELEFD